MASSTSASPGDPGGVVEGSSLAQGMFDASGHSQRHGGSGEVAAEGLPSQQIGLEAFIKEAKPKRKGKGSSAATPAPAEEDQEVPSPPLETATCPVCGEFEGDEAAVSHHVASHFDSGS